MKVWVYGEEFPQIQFDECDSLDGWAWLPDDPTAVRLCGAACERSIELRPDFCKPGDGAPALEVKFGCPVY